MHYSDNPNQVRVDFFRESGEWYCTEAVEWTGAYLLQENEWGLHHGDMYTAFRKSLHDHFGEQPRLQGMWAVCLDPYHERPYPLMVRV